MAAKVAGSKNFYSQAKSNPEVLEKRKQRVQELDADVNRMQSRNPGRVPDWDEERLMRMDKAALQHGKRCVMWDDTGAGFYLMLNWDWVRNCPKSPASPQEAFEPGWWLNAKKLLKNPLIDPHVADDKLAAWIDAHTMRVHHRLLKNLGAVRAGAVAGSYELDTSTGYGAQLKALNP